MTNVSEVATDPDDGTAMPSFRDMLAVFRVRHLWAIILIVMLSWTFYTVFDQQMFPDFYTSLFDTKAQGQATYGVLNSVQVFLEAAMMMVVPLIMLKIGVRNTLLLGFVVMCVRIGGCAVVDDPVSVSAIKMLHALEVPLCILPIFRYFTLHFDPKLSATLYLVGFQVSAQIGNMLFSAPLGTLHDNIGYQPTFLIIAGVVAAAAAIAWFVLKRDHEDVNGEPFYRDSELAAMRAAGDTDDTDETDDKENTNV
jgi:OHS family lactose permease-like MFS transporter